MIKTCPEHGDFEVRTLEMFGCFFESGCPECEKIREEKEAEAERKSRERLFQEDLVKRGIEEEYWEASLEKYRAENESEKQALEAARELEEGRIKKMLLLGSNGTGKTFLGCALAIKLHGIRTTMYELSAKIRSGYQRGESELEILNGLLSYPLIVLDEVGRTKGSEAEKNWLSYLIDKAHTRHIRLLIISNRHMAKTLPAAMKGEAIESFFDNDVISRLRQNSKIVEVKGRDRRAAAFTAV